MDSLKEDHLGSLIALTIALVGMTFYAFFEAMRRLFDFEPWSIASVLLGFGGFVCLVRMISLVYRRGCIYRLGRDIESRRSQDNFSLDQSTSTSLIDMTCRLQTCRKRSNIHLIVTFALAVSLIGGTVLAYQQGTVAIAATQAHYVALQQEATQRIQQAEEAKQADRAKILEEIELQRIVMQTEIETSLIGNLDNHLDMGNKIVQEIKSCKKKPKKCYRHDENGTSDLISDYIGYVNHYEWALSNLVRNRLDEVLQPNQSILNDESLISELKEAWIQKIDQHFVELYHSGLFQDNYKQTQFTKHLNSHIKDERIREVVALMWYIDHLEQEIKKSASKYIKYQTIPFKSAFKTEFDGKYKEEDFDGPKAVRVRVF